MMKKTGSSAGNEKERINFLKKLDLLDAPPEEEFDRLTKLASRLLEMPIVQISILAEDREWYKSSIGTDVKERPRDCSICAHTILNPDSPTIIENIENENEIRKSEFSQEEPTPVSYIGVPISVNDFTVGTFSARDTKPRDFSETDVENITMLARQTEDLIRRKNVENEVKHRRREFERLFHGTTHGLIRVNEKGEIEQLNDVVLDIFGYDREELIGESIEILVPEKLRAVHRDERNQYTDDPETRPMGEGRDLVGVSKSGQEIPIEVGLNPLKTSSSTKIIADITDISERKRTEEDLENTKERFQQIAETIEEVFWIFTPYLRTVKYVSPAYEKIWEQDTDALLNNAKTWLDRIHAGDRDEVRDEFFNQGPTGNYEKEFRLEIDGKTKWIRDRCFTICDDDGDITRIIRFSEDITDLKQTQRSLEETVEQKETLLQELHHRVKNNLQVLTSFIRLQKKEQTNQDFSRFVQQIQDRIRTMALIHEKLFSSDQISNLDFSSYLRELVNGIVQSHSQDDLVVNVEYDLEPELELGAEKAISAGLIVNELVTNALQHAFEDTLKGTIRLELSETTDQLVITVSDDGVGFNDIEELQQKSFGYQIVRSLAEDQLDGSISVFENDNNGSSFQVSFPKNRS
jgi:PAS domain S-box-containing protein